MVDPPKDEHRKPILLVEDADDDLILLQRAIRCAGILNPIVIMHSGEAAMAYLERACSKNADWLLPAVVLSDLKMPGVNGVELASWIKKHDELSNVRVMILSSSNHPRDFEQAKAAGVDRYVVKFPRADEIRTLINGS